MEQNNEWVNKYLTPEQQEQMQHLSEHAYSGAQRAEKLAARGPWTEADQEQANAQWAAIYAEARRLAAAGADPPGAEAQALARRTAPWLPPSPGATRRSAPG